MPAPRYPIKHWSYSSLVAYLRNPLAWYKRYVERVYDTPSGVSSFVGRAGHVALQHFYSGLGKEAAISLGYEYLDGVPDFEINFGTAVTKKAMKQKRIQMLEDYTRAVGFYLARPPKYKVLGVEVSATAVVKGLPLPIKAISDLVVQSALDKNAVDIVDHKFVDSFSSLGADKPLFVIQALFNYYTIQQEYKKPVKRFILQECKKRKNKNGGPQMRKYVLNYDDYEEDFALFHRLVADASEQIRKTKVFLPNPSDMFEGKNSFEVYRLQL